MAINHALSQIQSSESSAEWVLNVHGIFNVYHSYEPMMQVFDSVIGGTGRESEFIFEVKAVLISVAGAAIQIHG